MILKFKSPAKVQSEANGEYFSLTIREPETHKEVWCVLDVKLMQYLRLVPGSTITCLKLRHLTCVVEDDKLAKHPWLWLCRRKRYRRYNGTLIGAFLFNLTMLNTLLKKPFSV